MSGYYEYFAKVARAENKARDAKRASDAQAAAEAKAAQVAKRATIQPQLDELSRQLDAAFLAHDHTALVAINKQIDKLLEV